MKTAHQVLVAILALSCTLRQTSAEDVSGEAIVKTLVDYVGKIEGLDINWPKSMAETAKITRYPRGAEGIFLVFLIEDDQTASLPPLALMKNDHFTHHEAINSTIEGANYEFIWPAAGLNPDGSWQVIVFVRQRKPLP